jgi:hypothetical protein
MKVHSKPECFDEYFHEKPAHFDEKGGFLPKSSESIGFQKPF